MSSQNHFLLSLDGPVRVTGLFQTKTGGNKSATISRDYDGGASVAVLAKQRPTYSALTLGRRYDAGRDDVLAAALRPYVDTDDEWTATVQPTDGNFRPIGVSTTYRAGLSGVNEPDVDANGTGFARWGVTLEVKEIISS